VRWDLLLPDATRMWEIAVEHHWLYLDAWGETFRVSLIASAAAFFLAIALAALALRFRLFERLFEPFVIVSQSFPLQAIAPLIIIALGRGDFSKVSIAFLIAFFPLFAVVLSALKNTPQALLALCRTTDASFATAIVHVYLPSALPAIVAGGKVAFTLAVLGSVVAEFVAPTSGIGRLLLRAQSDYNVDAIYLCLGMLIVQGLTVYLFIALLESRVVARWR
jgi:NitT/TauT family transport system permease protein